MARPQLKFKAPPNFMVKLEEDAFDWLQWYEATGAYNRWTDDDLRDNFGMYLDGIARKWFLCLKAPAEWNDTPAQAA